MDDDGWIQDYRFVNFMFMLCLIMGNSFPLGLKIKNCTYLEMPIDMHNFKVYI